MKKNELQGRRHPGMPEASYSECTKCMTMDDLANGLCVVCWDRTTNTIELQARKDRSGNKREGDPYKRKPGGGSRETRTGNKAHGKNFQY